MLKFKNSVFLVIALLIPYLLTAEEVAKQATTLTAEIIGPSTLEAGKLGILESKVEGATTQLWYPLDPNYSHADSENKKLIVTGDKSEKRKYVLFVSNGIESIYVEHELEITKADCPDDNPDSDGPEPEPSLSKLTTEWLKTVPAGSLSRKTVIKQALDNTIKAAKENKFITINELEQALGILLGSALSGSVGWNEFGELYNAEITRLKGKRIIDVQSYAQCLTEISGALQ